MLTVVTGGARSGKSAFAEKLLMNEHHSGVYIATAQAFDDEMRERIADHRRTRDSSRFAWTTLEEPHALAERVRELGLEADGTVGPAVLIDCLTLWLSNRLLQLEQEKHLADLLAEEIREITDAAASYPGSLIVVTNEVGSGIVPEYPLGRMYRDWAGRLNQRMAERAERVFLVTAGIPVELKAIAYRFTDVNNTRGR